MLDLSGFIVKGRREGAQMVFGSDTKVHIWCCERYPQMHFNILGKKAPRNGELILLESVTQKVTLFSNDCRVNLILWRWRNLVVFINLMTYFFTKCDRKHNLPSGSRSCGMPSSVSANKKASCRFSRLGLLHTCSMSTRFGRRALITAKNANPVCQLGPKSFTSIPRRLEMALKCQSRQKKAH